MTVTETEVFMTREDIVARMDEGAAERLGVNAQEMMAAYRVGRLDPTVDVSDLLMLADLLPVDDELSPSFRP